jgi:hypothetical protein
MINELAAYDMLRIIRGEGLPAKSLIWRQAISNGLWESIPDARAQLGVEIRQILTSGPVGWLSYDEHEMIAERVRAMFGFWRKISAT